MPSYPSITQEYILDRLTEENVSILVTTYIQLTEESSKQIVGNPVRTCYSNTPRHREELENILPENYWNAIVSVWGEKPVMDDVPAPNDNLDESENQEEPVIEDVPASNDNLGESENQE